MPIAYRMEKHRMVFDPSLGIPAIAALLESADGFLAVTDEAGRLLGTISDGDLRRAVLSGKQHLSEVINRQPPAISAQSWQARMDQARHFSSPYVVVQDREGRVQEIRYLSPPERQSRPNAVVVMAGGLGRRLGELTRELPKPMLRLGHKPILHIIVDSFREYGFTEFYFCVNYKSEVIREYFGDGASMGVTICYVEESEPMGTAGPLRLLPRRFSHPFFVIYGDLVTTLDFTQLLKFHFEREAIATMCTHEYSYRLPYGVIQTHNSRIVSIEEKPYERHLINAGIYVLNPEAMDLMPDQGYCDMTTLLGEWVARQAPVHSYIINDFWVDIGQVKDYEYARQVFTQYNIR